MDREARRHNGKDTVSDGSSSRTGLPQPWTLLLLLAAAEAEAEQWSATPTAETNRREDKNTRFKRRRYLKYNIITTASLARWLDGGVGVHRRRMRGAGSRARRSQRHVFEKSAFSSRIKRAAQQEGIQGCEAASNISIGCRAV